VPADNPMSQAKVRLGRRLFYDTRLSGNGTYSCASCHRQELAFTDGRARAVGSTGEPHPRGAMSLANVAYNRTFNWADPAIGRLEEQLAVPLFNRAPIELGLAGREAEVEARLRDVALYREAFAAAFPERQEPISLETVVLALASFERTLVSGDSPYDRLVFRDEREAMGDAARRGMRLFFSERLACFECHSGLTFSGPVVHRAAPVAEPVFHNTGLYAMPPDGSYPVGNRGLYETTLKVGDMGRFRAPTLRNIAVTAPYMHDGSLETLEQVLDHYAAGGRLIPAGPYAGDGRVSPYKSELVRGFEIDDQERADVIAFLESLTDRTFLTAASLADPWRARSDSSSAATTP
jgi:cytochrome c peroxidase